MKILFAAFAAAILSCPAHAAVITLVQPVFNQNAQTIEPTYTSSFSNPTNPVFRLRISDAAVSRGSFDFNFTSIVSPAMLTQTGDVADFMGFQISIDNILPGQPTSLPTYLTAHLRFDAAGAVTQGTLSYQSEVFAFDFSGAGEAFGGTFIPGPNSRCGGCVLTGKLVDTVAQSVPEPADFGWAMMLVGIGAISVARARSR